MVARSALLVILLSCLACEGLTGPDHPPLHLFGMVKRIDCSPAANVQVVFLSRGDCDLEGYYCTDTIHASTGTDADGRFDFGEVERRCGSLLQARDLQNNFSGATVKVDCASEEQEYELVLNPYRNVCVPPE